MDLDLPSTREALATKAKGPSQGQEGGAGSFLLFFSLPNNPE